MNAVAYAQTHSVSRAVKATEGQSVRIGIYASIRRDCTPGSPPSVRLKVPPRHGKVTVKTAKLRTTNLRQCLAVETPAFVAIYQSAPDYSGYDVVILEVKSGTKVQVQKFLIKVVARSNSQRIDSNLVGSAVVPHVSLRYSFQLPTRRANQKPAPKERKLSTLLTVNNRSSRRVVDREQVGPSAAAPADS
jgi:hypothetical protein